MVRPGRHGLRRLAFAFLALTLLPITAAHAKKHEFLIRSQLLTQALAEFSAQADLSMDYSSVDLSGLRAARIEGTLEAPAALRLLLRGTGLDFEYVTADSVRIVKPKPASAQAPAPSPSTAPATIDQLTVTGIKRDAYLQALATSAAVVPEVDLDAVDIAGTAQLAGHVAGLTTTNMGAGRNKIFVRGLSDGPFDGITQSVVGIYLDDTPINFNAADPDLRLVDMQQVEILRGPQGTLYGSGSIAGVYRMVPNKPVLDDTFGRISAGGVMTRGGSPGGSGQVMLNTPLVSERLGLRMVGYLERDGGYIDDIRLGERNINESQVVGGRGTLRWAVSDDWAIDLSATLQYIDQDDSQYAVAGVGRFLRDNYLPQPYHDHVRIVSVSARGDVGWATVTSSTSILDRSLEAHYDASLSVPYFVPLGVTPAPFRSSKDIDTLSHETRLASNENRPFRWLAGGFLAWSRGDYDDALDVPGSAALLGLSGPFADDVYTRRFRQTSLETAIFGEVEWFFLDQVSFTAGGRVSRNEAKDVVEIGGSATLAANASARSERVGFVPKLALSYRPDDDLTLYLRAEKGFRPGGFNAVPEAGAGSAQTADVLETFGGDTLWNYELGLKSLWLDGALRLDAAAFLVRWQDIQSIQIARNGLSQIINAGSGRNLGFELELSARLFDGLAVSGNLLVNSPELTSPNPALGISEGIDLPAVAEIVAGARIDYRFEVKSWFSGRFTLDYAYMGRSMLTFAAENSPRMGGYHLLNARLELTRGAATLGFAANNIANSARDTFAFGNPFALHHQDQITPLRPRSFGIFLDYSF